jgi:hypothetical protein
MVFPDRAPFPCSWRGVWRDCADCNDVRPPREPRRFRTGTGVFARFFASVAALLARRLGTPNDVKTVGKGPGAGSRTHSRWRLYDGRSVAFAEKSRNGEG